MFIFHGQFLLDNSQISDLDVKVVLFFTEFSGQVFDLAVKVVLFFTEFSGQVFDLAVKIVLFVTKLFEQRVGNGADYVTNRASRNVMVAFLVDIWCHMV